MSEVSYYNTFAIVSLIVFILLVALDVIIWIKLDVRHYLAVLSGSEAKKTIDKIRQDAESGAVQADRRRRGGNAVISWNTSEGLEENMSTTRPLSMDPDKTVLLSQGETTTQAMTSEQADPYATMVLNTINQQTDVISQTQTQAGGSYVPEGYQNNETVSMPGFVVEKEIVNTAGREE